ncbi:phytase [Vibrio gangliei]|uniref:phytase n=1 Tax=Vibrio gangliei TaxID=2077090 RepID=UPI000D01AF99|nr:phytase [Vibrio gangliei]
MSRKIISSLIAVALLSGCNSETTETVYLEAQQASDIEPELLSTSITTNTSYGDIGDSSYWINSDNKAESLLFVSLEGDGVAVYSAAGKEIDKLEGIGVTGADIRYDIKSESSETADILAIALPDQNSFGFYSIDYADGVILSDLGTVVTDYAVEGVCLHKNTTNGELLVTGVTEDGVALQYKLKYENGQIQSILVDDSGIPIAVRELAVGGELSACVVDDETSTLYIAEQDVGIWAYGADPEDINSRRMVDSIEPLGYLQEIEALDLIYMPEGKGYLVVGDEGKGMVLYRRDDWQLNSHIQLDGVAEIKSFSVADDGIWVANSEKDEPIYEKLTFQALNTANSMAQSPISQALSPEDLSSSGIRLVKVTRETVPVEDDGDAADDPAFWLNENSPGDSLIIATNKQGGLMAYDLLGNELQYLNEGEPNNVDIIQSVRDQNGQNFALAAASNREFNTIALYQIQAASEDQDPIKKLKAVGANAHTESAELQSELNEVYGLCTYQANDGTPYVFVNGKSGDIEQWRLTINDSSIEGSIVRRLKVASQPEGCVVDEQTGTLYVGEEDVGIWKFSANEGATTTGEMIIAVDGETLVADAEGISIYNNGIVNYLIVSSQGNHTYAVYDLDDAHQYIGSFALVADDANKLDGVSETDGIHAVSTAVGDAFPDGLFIAQDGFNVNENYEYENQNFKIISWTDIQSSLQK